MSCNLRIINSKEIGFTDAGIESQLYKEAVNTYGEKEGKDIFLVSLSDEFKETIPPAEPYNAQKIANKYRSLISKIKKEQPDLYWSVDQPSDVEIQKAAEEGRIADVQGGMGLVMPDGNMVGLFKYDQSAKNTAKAVQEARIKLGGIKMDNFDGYLTRTYEKNGFRVAARIPFNTEYAPEGWKEELHGKPDVVFMIYDLNNRLDIEEKTFEDYEEAKNYRDSFVEEAKNLHPAYSVSPETSSNFANLTTDGEGNFVFYHRGGKGYETIKRTVGATTATGREEAAALSKVGGVVMYYTSPTDAESMVAGGSKYMVKVPMEKVYDFNTDPLNLINEAKETHAKEHPGKAFDANTQVAYITKIAGERGYEMVVSEWDGRTRAQTTTEFTPIDVQEIEGSRIVKPFKKDYISNKEKGYISIIPQSKESQLEEVYKEIYKERNRANRYDDLYRLPENSVKMTQEEITNLIMSSDLSEELKNRYQSILSAPIQKRESVKAEEPSLESVMQYITSKNESKEPMNEEQIRDFQNVWLSTENFNYEKLKDIFYDENGVFFVNSSKLIKSRLYTQYEAEHLQKDFELQEKVKTSLEALKNTDDVQIQEQLFDTVEKENEFTSFGKLNNLNPYIVQKQIQQVLAATTREEFDELIGELPFSNFQKSMQSEEVKNKLFNDMQTYKKAEIMYEVKGVIKPSLNSNTEVIVPQTAQDLTDTKVLKDIKYILNQDLVVLKALPDKTGTLLKSIEEGLIAQGYDVIGLETKSPDAYLMEYLSAVVDLSEQNALEEYVRVYDNYFEKDLSAEKGFVKSNQDDRNFVKLDTFLTEEEVYNQQGLIKQSKGLYIKVNKKSAEELYPIVLTYPEKLPNDVTTELELRKYVQNQTNSDEVSNPETNEIINLFKIYYGVPLVSEIEKVNMEAFNKKQNSFDGDAEYLTKDFISDFYIDSLKEKAEGSRKYRDFYRHFDVNDQGLYMVNDDSITLETIKPYVDENLANYSLINKNMPNLKESDEEIVDSKNNRRDLISNHPQTIKKFEGNVSIIDNDNLVSKNVNDEFIRLKNDVYENMQTIGNLTLFTKLVKNDKSPYYNFNVSVPVSEYRLEDYLHLSNSPEAFIESKNYLSKEEKEDLQKDEFQCL